MFTMVFEIEYTGILANPPKGWKDLKKQLYKDAAKMYHGTFAEGKFGIGAFRKYGYAKRTAKYTKQKYRVKGHRDPMVWSGKTKRQALSKWRVIGKRGGGAQLIVNARGLNRRPKDGRIRMRQEFERVAKSEMEYLAKRAETQANRGLRALSQRKRRRKKIGA